MSCSKLSVLIAVVFAMHAQSQPVEPKAGQWKTWVLASGDQMRLPAPPAAAATASELQWLRGFIASGTQGALDQIAYWDSGSPGYRWIEMTITDYVKPIGSSVFATRALGIMGAAIYDATIAAWDTKYAYNRPRPNEVDPTIRPLVSYPNSPSYPSEHAVVAGAASVVLGYLVPSKAQDYVSLAEEAARSRLFAGTQYPSDVLAGLQLGRAIGALMVSRAQADGSDAVWTGSVPTDPGKWRGTNPALPLAGTWKSWVLAPNSQFRSGPPPAFDSAQELAELAEVKNVNRTFDTNRAAFFWQGSAQAVFYDILQKKLFEYEAAANPPRAARAYALAGIAYADASIACWDAKYTYWAIRPFQLDPTVTTLFPTPNHPSYPSAHACQSNSVATVLEALFPNDAQLFADQAIEAGNSRIWAGIHFRSDIVAGAALGQAVANAVLERAKTDGSQ